MPCLFIDVRKTNTEHLPCTSADLSAELIADLLPLIVVSSPVAYFGWPMQLLEETESENQKLLTIHPMVGRCDRQWKGFISWMLGVAGARTVLKHQGYRWIAPASAFYAERRNVVDVNWPNDFPSSDLALTKAKGNKSKLRPDYVAIKPGNSGSYRITSVEVKGTAKPILTNRFSECPKAWAQQVRNISLTSRGTPLQIARHLVVGTYVEPNGKSIRDRRLGIRAWNHNETDDAYDNKAESVLPIVYAHLIGLFGNLGQQTICERLARSMSRNFGPSRLQMSMDFEEKDGTNAKKNTDVRVEKIVMEKLRNGSLVEITISDELAKLTEELIDSKSTTAATQAFLSGERLLDRWGVGREAIDRSGVSRLACGVEVSFK